MADADTEEERRSIAGIPGLTPTVLPGRAGTEGGRKAIAGVYASSSGGLMFVTTPDIGALGTVGKAVMVDYNLLFQLNVSEVWTLKRVVTMWKPFDQES